MPKISLPKDKLINTLSVAGVVIVFGALLFGSYLLGVKKETQVIVVTGEAKQEKSNQIAMFSANVSSVNSKKVEAVTDLNKKSTSVVTAVKTFGIDDKDIKTNYFNVYQNTQWDPSTQTSKLTDWTASLTVEITLRDVVKAGELGMLLAQLDTASVNGPNLQLDDQQKQDIDLLQSALEAAKEKAEKLALSSGRKLGKLLSVYEGGVSNQPIIYKDLARGMGGGGSGLPIEPGSSSLFKTVTATYELK